MQIALIISPFSDLKSINTHSSWSPGKCSASGGGWTNGFLDVIGRRDRNGNGWFDLLEFGLEFKRNVDRTMKEISSVWAAMSPFPCLENEEAQLSDL